MEAWGLWLVGAVAAGVLAFVGFGAGMHHHRWTAYHRRKGLSLPPSPWAWLTAGSVDWLTLGWWHLAGFLRDGRLGPSSATGPLVVCLHGYTQNATNLWGLRRYLARHGRASAAISLTHRLAPMSWYAQRLEYGLEALLSTEPRVDVVAHSMGGVVLRVVLARRPEWAPRIRRVVTLGTPHRGTASSRGIPFVPEVHALRRRSALLAELPHLSELLPAAVMLSVAGTHDTIVYPTSSTRIPGTPHVVLSGLGHAGLLTRVEAMAAVRAHLEGTSPQGTHDTVEPSAQARADAIAPSAKSGASRP